MTISSMVKNRSFNQGFILPIKVKFFGTDEYLWLTQILNNEGKQSDRKQRKITLYSHPTYASLK